MVFVGSRYEGLRAFVYTDESGKVRRCLEFRTALTELDVSLDGLRLVEASSDDTLDLLSTRHGGIERDWFKLAEISGISDPLEIAEKTIKVPVSELVIK